jgi:hypothetical protein
VDTLSFEPMRTVHSLAVTLLVGAPLLAANACSVFEPEVGPRQQSAVTAAPAPTDVSGYGPRPDAGGGGDPRCLADGGYQDNPCDACENGNCCATRFGCYDDHTCYAANTAFDPCITAAVDAQGQPDPVAVKKCWDALAASGPAGTARVDCQRTKCQTICGVP